MKIISVKDQVNNSSKNITLLIKLSYREDVMIGTTNARKIHTTKINRQALKQLKRVTRSGQRKI